MTRTLILAAGPAWADRAARHVVDDAVVHIGDPAEYDTPTGADDIDNVVVSGDLEDERWVSASFEVAARCLGAGHRVVVIVAAGRNSASDDTGFAAAPSVPQLPADVAAAWRVVGITVEHQVAAILFQRASDDDGATATAEAFRCAAQLLAYAYARPGTLPHVTAADEAVSLPDGDPDTELANVRRELAAYKNSTLGRLTSHYWRLRRSIDERVGRMR